MVSVVIPAYEMQGRGNEFLFKALSSIPYGTEIIISCDYGFEQEIDICQLRNIYCHHSIVFLRNKNKQGAAGNLNTAIDYASGDIIKVLFQDDQLCDGNMDKWVDIQHWAFCTSKHNNERPDHIPYHNTDLKSLALGRNTYGSPSAMAFRKTDLRFDENLKFLFDCEFYARMTERYGLPDIVDTFVNITEWDGMATRSVCTGDVRIKDTEYINKKYANI